MNIFKKVTSTLTLKRIILIVIVLSLLLIPTAAAFGYVFYFEHLKKTNYFSVTVYDEYNKVLAFEEDQPQNAKTDSLIDIFSRLTLSPTPTTLSDEAESLRHVIIETSYKNQKNRIKCYFSAENDTGFYIDSQGNVFLIPKDINKIFLSTKYAEAFYKNAKIYKLTTLDNDEIVPSSVVWNYKNLGGDFIASEKNVTVSKRNTYEIMGAIEIKFENEPNISSVSVYERDERIYHGSIHGLSALTVETGSTLRVKIEAEWKQKAESDRYGVVYYDFYVKIKNQSVFSISSDTVHAGDFISLECTNISDPSKIIFKSETSGYSPTFATDNNIVKALLFFPESKDEKKFSFSIAYGASMQDFSITVLPTESSGEFSISTASFSSSSAPSILNNMKKGAIHGIIVPHNDNVYFRGNFSTPDDLVFDTAYTHNGTVKWMNESGEEFSYTAFGNEYTVKSDTAYGSSVKTLQNGIVSCIGQDATLGKYVIIDHGCGIRTWYTNLSAVDVELNDIVLTGQHLGKTGNRTVSGKEGFILYCTIYDTIINPNALWKK